MFKLTTDQIEPVAHVKKLNMSRLFVGLGIQKSITKIRQNLATSASALESYDELRLFKSALKQDGLTPSLLRFANADGSLSKLAPSLPSLEEMDGTGIRAGDRRLQASHEEIDNVLRIEPTAVSDFINESVEHLEDLFNHLKDQLSALDEASIALSEDLIRGIPQDMFTKVTATVISADALHQYIEALTHVVTHLHHPENEDFNNLPELVSIIAKATGVGICPEGKVCIDHTAIAPEYVAKEQTLSEAGYTSESLLHLLHGIDTLADELVELSNVHDKMIGDFHSRVHNVKGAEEEEGLQPEPGEERVGYQSTGTVIDAGGSSGDGGGLDAGSVATEGDDDDLGGEESLKSLKDDHKHISGYLTLIMVVIESSLSVIQEVLEITESVVNTEPAPMEEPTADKSDDDDEDGDDTELDFNITLD